MIKNYAINEHKQAQLHITYEIWQTRFTDTGIRVKTPEGPKYLTIEITKTEFIQSLINTNIETITISQGSHAVTIDLLRSSIMYYWDKSAQPDHDTYIAEICDKYKEAQIDTEISTVQNEQLVSNEIKLINRVILKEEIIYEVDQIDDKYFTELLPELESDYDKDKYSIVRRFEKSDKTYMIITIRKYS